MTTSPTNDELKKRLQASIERQSETIKRAKETARARRAASGEESIATRG